MQCVFRRHAMPIIVSVCLYSSLLLSCRASARQENTGDGIRIATLAPALTSIVCDLGLSSRLVAVDNWSESPANGPLVLDMMNPDVEQLAAIEADILFVSTMTRAGTSKDPFKPLSDTGIRVEYIDNPVTIEEIRELTRFMAGILEREEEAERLITAMDGEIQRVSAITSAIPADKRLSVVFEISPAPWLYTFGKGVYLNEVLELAGAVNIFADQSGWIGVSAEAVAERDPDVILTNAGSPEEIMSRPGWKELKAVRNARVYAIDRDASSQPTPAVVRALAQIAEVLYPDLF